MSLLETIQQKLILKPALRRHQKVNSHKAFISITQARTLGLMADLREDQVLPALTDFYKKIRSEKKKVSVLLLIGEKRANINLYDYEKLFVSAEVYVVCPEDLNWFGVPAERAIRRFTETPFDLLIRFDQEPNFTLDMVLSKSRSSMLAGAYHAELPFLDFTIRLKPNDGYNGLSVNLVKYLQHLNEKQKPEANTSHKTLF